jgi:hypothetical protein
VPLIHVHEEGVDAAIHFEEQRAVHFAIGCATLGGRAITLPRRVGAL